MTYEQFKQRVESAGLSAKQCTPDHWQILGGVVPVNYYPTTKRGSVYYIQGAKEGKPGTLSMAIESVLNGAAKPAIKSQDKIRRDNRKIVNKKLKRDPHCHWCKCELEEVDATIDHVVPTSKGGADHWNNIVPACLKCNHDRGNSLLPPWEETKAEQPEEKLVIYSSWWRVVGDAVALVTATAAGFGLIWLIVEKF